MKRNYFAIIVSMALVGLPGCCCPRTCVPQLGCANPYWMEDLQYGCCETVGHVNFSLCQFKHSLACQYYHLKSQLAMNCQCQMPSCRCSSPTCAQRPCFQQPCPQQTCSPQTCPPKSCAQHPSPATKIGVQSTKSCRTRECHPQGQTACRVQREGCDQLCRRCKQQPCRCGACDCGDHSVGSAESQGPSSHSDNGPVFTTPGSPNVNRAPNAVDPGPQPYSPTPAAPLPPGKTMGPTPIPDLKILPQGPAGSVPAPPNSADVSPVPLNPTNQTAEVSIPLENQDAVKQVEFRKVAPQRPLYNGWKPVTELPKTLR
jgi:hypothetical protein